METETASATETHIGNRVNAARVQLGISRETLASELGVTPEQLQKYEDGESLTSARRLYEIARALGVDVSYFYEGLSGATSCPFSLSGERYALLQRAVQRIAADHELTRTGRRKKLPRHEAINTAREVCLALGWSFGKAGAAKIAEALPAKDSILHRQEASAFALRATADRTQDDQGPAHFSATTEAKPFADHDVGRRDECCEAAAHS